MSTSQASKMPEYFAFRSVAKREPFFIPQDLLQDWIEFRLNVRIFETFGNDVACLDRSFMIALMLTWQAHLQR